MPAGARAYALSQRRPKLDPRPFLHFAPQRAVAARVDLGEQPRARLARQLGAVRLSLCEAEPTRSPWLYEKALRYEHLVGRLENRIRVAMLALAER